MATATVRLIPIVLDKGRNLRLDFNAIATAEELTGKNILAAGALTEPSARDVRALLFAMLKHEDANLTLEDVGAMLHPGNVLAVTQAIKAAIEQAMPPKAEAEGEGDEAQQGKALELSIT